ncbi:MAG TPA: choice-of-anchor B family protein, partial [Gemmatimonadales bacterium]|nr:choice-of-anchor B family protein [Gemmatimonadales bacterium]
KGTVYVYRQANGAWREAAQLSASDGFQLDRFGRSLSHAAGRLLVGSTSIDSARGAAYLFERTAAGNWNQAAKLVPGSARAGDSWGRAVLLTGDAAFAAAWGSGEGRGAVAVWRRGPGGQWNEEAILRAGDARPGDFFGTALAADGDRVLIGASQKDSSAGAAYVFRRDPSSGLWQQEARLEADGLEPFAGFGTAVFLRGDEALVGAPGLDRNAGRVLVFRRDQATGAWTQARALRAFDGQPAAQFGLTLAQVRDEIWIGSPGARAGRGQIYRFAGSERDGWQGVSLLEPGGLENGDGAGGAIAADRDLAVVGLTGDDFGMGTALILSHGRGGWTAAPKVWADMVTLDRIVGGKVECREGQVQTFGCANVDLLAYLPIKDIGGARGTRLNDIWGWTDPQTGREYALVGRIDGTAFVDVTDPSSPTFLGSLPRTAGSPASAWRDIKVYRDHAFIVADGAGDHGMQVFDLTRLRRMAGAPGNFEEDVHYDRIASAHNIVIDTTTGFAFAVGVNGGGETCGGALHMIDIRNPRQPAFAGCFSDPATGRQRTGYTHDAQCVVYHGPDAEHRGREICFNASETAVGIADVTDKRAPTALSSASYPNVGYTHQGWLSDDQRHFYVNDELDELSGGVAGTRTLIWDVSDLDDPVLVREYVSDNRASDHNLYIKDGIMYQSNYASGLRLFDVRDPANPIPVGYFDTVPVGEDAPGFTGSWSNYPYFRSGTLVVTSIDEGLFILRRSDRPLIP